MATIGGKFDINEPSWQMLFYQQIFGNDLDGITIDRSTDGYTPGILFEQKQNVTQYGKAKALSQAIIYLTRFNRDGIPVPAKICLVSQDEGKCFIYNSQNYIRYIDDIEKYANMKASEGIPGFQIGAYNRCIEFNLSSARGMREILSFVEEIPANIKVHINEHNVYGWSEFYYNHANEYGQKPEKKAFFNELRHPVGTLAEFICPWEGVETDFKYIMDLLNDPMTQKKTGAFYTPPEYVKLACELVRKAIDRAKAAGKRDYIILDRCAGTGNLEMAFNEDELSHVIVSTYELKEWMVLKDRFGNQVRYIIPPIPKTENTMPDLNNEGFLSGANALSRDILDNEKVMRYVNDPDCAVILYENPPYAETTGIEFQKRNLGKEASTWKKDYVVEEMKKCVSGTTTNDMGNAFIWSGFKYFLTDPADSYIVFSPVKYWKAQHLIHKRFVEGYAFNRKHFHAPTPACIMCAYWANEEEPEKHEIILPAIDIGADGKLVNDGVVDVKQIFSIFSEKYYDKRVDPTDLFDGITCELNGKENHGTKKQISVEKNWNTNIIGYVVAKTSGFDNPRLSSALLIAGKYDAHGFYLRSDNFMEKLPIFAASRYTDHCNNWKVMSMVMKSGDKAERYEADVRSGKLDVFLFHTMFWTCMTHYAHMRSLNGSDGRLYLNQLCFDGDTLARQKMEEFIAKGYRLTDEENLMLDKMNLILAEIKHCDEYNFKYNYGLYQIDEEINIKVSTGKVKPNGEPKKVFKYGDLNEMIKEIKNMAKKYYQNLIPTLFEYEFLK